MKLKRRIHSVQNNLIGLYLKLRFNKISRINTHLTHTEKYNLYKLAKKTKGKVLVEIGSFIGASSCFIAEGLSNGSTLYCVDTWENDSMTEGKRNTFNEFTENTKDYSDVIKPMKGTSEEISKTFTADIDFIFIDGDHSYEGAKTDIDCWFPKLKTGKLIAMHDVGWAEGVQQVLKEDVLPHVDNKKTKLPNLFWSHKL